MCSQCGGTTFVLWDDHDDMPVDPPSTVDLAVDSPLFPGRISTDRFELRAATPTTVDPIEFYERTNPEAPHVDEITHYLPWDPNPTVKAALDHLQAAEEGFRDSEYATYLIIPREDAPPAESGAESKTKTETKTKTKTETKTNVTSDDTVARIGRGADWVGTCSLDVEWDRRCGEYGVWLQRSDWGRGYGVAAGGALLTVAFERLDLELVEIQHEVGNDNSRAMIEKLVDRFGGRYDALLRNLKAGPDGPRDLHRFSVGRDEYNEATGANRTVDPTTDPMVIEK